MDLNELNGKLTYYPGRRTGGALLFIAALTAGLGLFVLNTPPGPDEPPWEGLSLGVCLILISIGAGIYAANELVRSLILMDLGVRHKDLRGQWIIPYEEIQAVNLTRHIHQKWAERVVRITGKGRRITFSSAMKGYAPFLENLLRRSPGVQLQDIGETPELEHERRAWERRRYTITLALIGVPVLLGGLLVVRSGYMLLLESRLDREGRKVNGRLIHATATLVEYRFDADGKVIIGRSATAEREYEQASPGDPIPVVYLPEDPTVCRIEGGIGRRSWYAFLAIGLMTFLLIPMLIQKPR